MKLKMEAKSTGVFGDYRNTIKTATLQLLSKAMDLAKVTAPKSASGGRAMILKNGSWNTRRTVPTVFCPSITLADKL